MRAFGLIVTLLFAAIGGASSSVSAQAVRPAASVRTARDTFRLLQAAVRNDDRRAVAALVVYPLRVVSGTRRGGLVRSPSQLIQQYPAIFTARVRSAVLKQDVGRIAADAPTVKVGNGDVWIGRSCETATALPCDAGVTTIDVAALVARPR